MALLEILSAIPKLWLVVGFLLPVIIYRQWCSRRSKQDAIGWRQIPQPMRVPILGNLLQIDLKRPLTSLNELGKAYRDIFRIDLPGTKLVIINSHRLYDEVCDNRRFHKEPCGGILEARNGGGDGLFTAFTDEEAWGIAHRILSPTYGQQGVKQFFADMTSITDSLVRRWHRFPNGYKFDPWDEFSLLSMDVISQSAFSINFSAIEKREIPSFVNAITDFFSESGQRAVRPSWITKYIFRRRDKHYWNCIEHFQTSIAQIVRERRAAEKGQDDVLKVMLETRDQATGKMMSEENCMYNALALLGAGYETVASLLSFTLICLMQNQQCLHKLQEEIADKLQGRTMTEEDLARLPYLTACIRETLRLYPSAPAHGLKLRQDAIVPGDPGLGLEQFHVKRSDIIRVNLMAIQRDPLVYGSDAQAFKPERMLEEPFTKLPRNSWKPFGTGVRICLGRYFALQEAHIVIAGLIQNFDFTFVDDRCDYEIGDRLILRPQNCVVKAIIKKPANLDDVELVKV